MEPMTLAILITAATIGLILIVWGITASRTSPSERLRNMAPTLETVQPVPSSGREDQMPTITRLLGGRKLTDRLFLELSSAGLPIKPSEYIGIIAGAVILSQLVAFIISKSILTHLLLGIVALSVPIIVLKQMQQKRRAAFNAQIVDALMMMASALRSGFSFLRAMQMVSQEMPAPIAQEFQRAINEINVGRSMEDALKGIVARVKSYDFDLAVTAVLIQLQVGGNLADILDTIASTIRERIRVLGEMSALTAEGRISGVVLVLLPIFMAGMMLFLKPDYIATLLREPIGRIMIITALCCQAVGGYIINKMLVLDI